MNNIGIGIICFFDKKYFIETNKKIEKIISKNIHCYILTDKSSWFLGFHGYNEYLHLIDYHRDIKSYHDKIILHKLILNNHNCSIVIDADMNINDYSFIDDLSCYEFNIGITYIDTLENHRWNKKKIGDINMSGNRWNLYQNYVIDKLPDYSELDTIWEYFIVMKKIDQSFYIEYDKLQIVKEYCDLFSDRVKIYGAGEGITTQIAAKLSNTQCQKDDVLYNLIANKIKPVLSSR